MQLHFIFFQRYGNSSKKLLSDSYLHTDLEQTVGIVLVTHVKDFVQVLNRGNYEDPGWIVCLRFNIQGIFLILWII